MSLNPFQRKTPKSEDLLSQAAEEYRAAGAALDLIQVQIRELRATPPALRDCLAIVERSLARRRGEFEQLADERLAFLFSDEFDPDDPGHLGQIDLTRIFGAREFGQFMYHGAAAGLWSDRILAFAEERLKAMGCGKAPTLAAKRARLAELEQEATRIADARDEALTLWRRLTGQKGGYPS